MAFKRDSLMIEINTAADGYAYRLWRWDTSPPPIPARNWDSTTQSTGEPPDHIFMIANDKTELKVELAALIDNQFDT